MPNSKITRNGRCGFRSFGMFVIGSMRAFYTTPPVQIWQTPCDHGDNPFPGWKPPLHRFPFTAA